MEHVENATTTGFCEPLLPFLRIEEAWVKNDLHSHPSKRNVDDVGQFRLIGVGVWIAKGDHVVHLCKGVDEYWDVGSFKIAVVLRPPHASA